MTEHTHKLGLGTVQFGLDYGINNSRGRVPFDEVTAILSAAADAGVRLLDTAHIYGTSEEVLGKALRATGLQFDIVSKLPDCAPEDVDRFVDLSLARLGVDRLYGYMLHDIATYNRHPAVFGILERRRREGVLGRLGFSLYYPDDLRRLMDAELPFDLVQIPLNLFDQRFVPLLEEAQERGVEVHVRSVFLQGLLFMEPERLPARLAGAAPVLRALHRDCAERGETIAERALGFVAALPGVGKLIVGVDSHDNLLNNIRDLNRAAARAHAGDAAKYAVQEEQIILPFLWKEPTT